MVVPGDDGVGPWKIVTQEGREIAKAESEDVGSSGGEDEVADEKFQTLRQADDENYEGICQGAMGDILASFELGEEEQKMEESKRTRRLSYKKKKASSQPAQRKVNARFFESDDEEAVFAEAKAERAKPRRGAPKGSSRASCHPVEKPSGLVADEAGEAGGGGDGDRDEGNSGKKRRGAPKKSVEAMEQELWQEFSIADKYSTFFSEVSEVKRRLLVRWGNMARLQAASAKDPARRKMLESCAKRLQIIQD